MTLIPPAETFAETFAVPTRAAPIFSPRCRRLGAALALGAGLLALPAAADDFPDAPSEAAVQAALSATREAAEKAIADGRTPGLSIAVVFGDQTLLAEGLGVRLAGGDEAVTADTVFQLASVSKPISSTVAAHLLAERKLGWDTPIRELSADGTASFPLSDPWISDHVTLADLFSHRSGLPDHAGDLLEDLGFDRAEILARLDQQPTAYPFRDGYAYTNFGLTGAAVALAESGGESWEAAAQRTLFEPLGMSATSTTFAGFESHANRAMGHVRKDGAPSGPWVHEAQREPDAQAPAGGVSSSANDMAKWLKFLLAKAEATGEPGTFEGLLAQAHWPQSMTSPMGPTGFPGFYGFGWNVGWTEAGLARQGHSGAFLMGASTTIAMVPEAGLAIAVLTNTAPEGLPEALCQIFLEKALTGELSRDWIALMNQVMVAAMAPDYVFDRVGPADFHPSAEDLAAYAGTYESPYYGKMVVSAAGDGLEMTLGKLSEPFALTPFDTDVFTFVTRGENAVGLSAIDFVRDASGAPVEATVGYLDETGLGTFARP